VNGGGGWVGAREQVHLADSYNDDSLVACNPQALNAEVVQVLPIGLGKPNVLPSGLTEMRDTGVLQDLCRQVTAIVAAGDVKLKSVTR